MVRGKGAGEDALGGDGGETKTPADAAKADCYLHPENLAWESVLSVREEGVEMPRRGFDYAVLLRQLSRLVWEEQLSLLFWGEQLSLLFLGEQLSRLEWEEQLSQLEQVEQISRLEWVEQLSRWFGRGSRFHIGRFGRSG